MLQGCPKQGDRIETEKDLVLEGGVNALYTCNKLRCLGINTISCDNGVSLCCHNVLSVYTLYHITSMPARWDIVCRIGLTGSSREIKTASLRQKLRWIFTSEIGLFCHEMV
jgi:hypothetical protein